MDVVGLEAALFGLTLLAAAGIGVRLKDRGLSWLLLPLVALVPGAVIGGLLSPWSGLDVGWPEALGWMAWGGLGTTWGAALALATGRTWNQRAALPVAGAMALLSVEAFVLLRWVSVHAPDAPSVAGVVLVAGAGLALLALKRGSLPQVASWTRGYRSSSTVLAVASVGCWWGAAELRAAAASDALAMDVLGNAASIGAWGLWVVTALAGVSLLPALERAWVRRVGLGLAAGLALALPFPLLGLRWSVSRTCDEHIRDEMRPVGALERRLSDEQAIRIEQGWCREPVGPTLDCPEVRTLYVRDGNTWSAKRLDQSLNDSLWGASWRVQATTWSLYRSQEGDLVRFGDWLISDGNREPEDLANGLQELGEGAARCLTFYEPGAPHGVVRIKVLPNGEVHSAHARVGPVSTAQADPERVVSEERFAACLVREAVRAEFPLSVCDAPQEVTVPLEWGER